MHSYAGNSIAMRTSKTNTINSFRKGLTKLMETDQSVSIKHDGLGAGVLVKSRQDVPEERSHYRSFIS